MKLYLHIKSLSDYHLLQAELDCVVKLSLSSLADHRHEANLCFLSHLLSNRIDCPILPPYVNLKFPHAYLNLLFLFTYLFSHQIFIKMLSCFSSLILLTMIHLSLFSLLFYFKCFFLSIIHYANNLLLIIPFKYIHLFYLYSLYF